MKRPLLIAAGALVLTLAAAGCSSSHSDAPDPGGSPGTHPAVMQFPNGFRNVAFACYGPNGVYVTSHGSISDLPSSVFVLPNDQHCLK